MKITKIQYTVAAEFAETNKQNIAKVMEELKSLNNPGIHYSSYVFDDGKTFMHYVVVQDEEAGKAIPNLEAFKHFQKELTAGNLEVPAKVENLTLVGSSYDLLS